MALLDLEQVLHLALRIDVSHRSDATLEIYFYFRRHFHTEATLFVLLHLRVSLCIVFVIERVEPFISLGRSSMSRSDGLAG